MVSADVSAVVSAVVSGVVSGGDERDRALVHSQSSTHAHVKRVCGRGGARVQLVHAHPLWLCPPLQYVAEQASLALSLRAHLNDPGAPPHSSKETNPGPNTWPM